MRPEILFPIFSSLTSLPGIGKRTAELVAKIAGPLVVDLLWHLPVDLIDRRSRPSIQQVEDGAVATFVVNVERHEPPRNNRMPYKVLCVNETGFLTLVFFRPRADYLRRILPETETVIVSGTVNTFQGGVQMTHPDFILPLKDEAELPAMQPVYGLTAGLNAKPLLKAIRAALQMAPDLPEWIDEGYLKQMGWANWHDSIQAAHNPSGKESLSHASIFRQRLAFDELLANQLTLCLMRHHNRKRSGQALSGDGRLVRQALSHLPYELTGAQRRTLEEIDGDLKTGFRMMRLLQGDVGAGKTVIAFLTMLRAVEAGQQAAMMAPTEILAMQHYAFAKPLAEKLGLELIVLTGRDKGAARAAKLAKLADGDAQLVVGTHALFQDDVSFRSLAIAVIDEQHRFGVHQRLMLSGKGRATDILVMTATPIPRTLAMTAYGDLDVSRLDELPPGRKPIQTRAIPLDRLDDIVAGIRRALKDGRQVYWVCPLVEDSEVISATAAEDRYDYLAGIFGDTVTLAHGRMKPAEKDAVMEAFQNGDKKLLVATTVIEVGVDVPNASIIVIEHAERFGLAQLHQLRGRVGRGSEASSCILLYAGPLGKTARSRLNIMRETQDGFRIAEEDLRLRGAGDLLGTRQAGLPEFRLADLDADQDLLKTAHDDARMIVQHDAHLSSSRGAALRILLYLFQQDEAVQYLRLG